MLVVRRTFLFFLALAALLIGIALLPSSAAKDVDLTVRKFASPDPVVVGDNITYLINIRNVNPSNKAGGSFFNDTLPPGVTYLSFNSTTSGITCTNFTTSVNCSIGDVAKNGVVNVTLKVRTHTTGLKINSVFTNSSEDTDTNLTNNTATASTLVNPKRANLDISKTDSVDPVKRGQMFVYNITVNNTGPQNATNVYVNDTLPSKVVFQSASGASCVESPANTISCLVPKINVSGSVSILVTVLANETGVAMNTASAEAAELDENLLDNVATQDTLIVLPQADLVLTKRDSDDPMLLNGVFSYVLNVTNLGPDDATNVNITDTLPSGITFQSSTGCSEWEPQTVSCEIGLLPNGTTAEFTIFVQADETGNLVNTAVVSSDDEDLNPDGNTVEEVTSIIPHPPASIACVRGLDHIMISWAAVADADGYALYRASGIDPFSVLVETTNTTWKDFTVTPGVAYFYRVTTLDGQAESDPSDECEGETLGANLTLVKRDLTDPVVVDQTFTYVLNLTNNGPDTANNVNITDTLPAGLEFVSSAGCTQWAPGSISCLIAALPSGASVEFSMFVKATTAGVHLNAASAVADERDGDESDNSAEEPTTANPLPPAMIDCVAGADFITISWSGVLGATGYSLHRAVGAGPFSKLVDTTNTTWDDATVTPGNTYKYRVKTLAGGLESEASAPCESTLHGREGADLVIEKRDTIDPAVVNQSFSYVLNVTNLGPSAATDVNVTDDLPSGVVFVSASAGCTQWKPGTVSCTIASLPNGSTASFSIAVKAVEAGIWVNPASALAVERDADRTNNFVNETTTVRPRAPVDVRCSSGKDQITITWGAVSGADGYNLYRAKGSGSFSLLVQTTNTTWVDATAPANEAFRYRVTTLDGEHESSASQACESTAIPVFPTLLIGALAAIGAVGAYAMWRRRSP